MRYPCHIGVWERVDTGCLKGTRLRRHVVHVTVASANGGSIASFTTFARSVGCVTIDAIRIPAPLVDCPLRACSAGIGRRCPGPGGVDDHDDQPFPPAGACRDLARGTTLAGADRSRRGL